MLLFIFVVATFSLVSGTFRNTFTYSDSNCSTLIGQAVERVSFSISSLTACAAYMGNYIQTEISSSAPSAPPSMPTVLVWHRLGGPPSTCSANGWRYQFSQTPSASPPCLSNYATAGGIASFRVTCGTGTVYGWISNLACGGGAPDLQGSGGSTCTVYNDGVYTDTYYGIFSNCGSSSSTTPAATGGGGATTTPTSGGGSGTTCFHKDTVITYNGIERRLTDFQQGKEPDCTVPHIVKATHGLRIAMQCKDSVTVLRLTPDHLVYTKNRGLVSAANLVKTDLLFADLEETRPCPILYLEPEKEEQAYFGLNCISSQVLANGIKTSTFGKYHHLPSAWMSVAGRVLGVERASQVGDYFAFVANKLGLL